MKRLLCALLGHRWKRTGITKQDALTDIYSEYQCRRCRARMWE